MESRNWKERITLAKNRELPKRGVSLPRDGAEFMSRLKEVESRGGFVAPAPQQDEKGILDAGI